MTSSPQDAAAPVAAPRSPQSAAPRTRLVVAAGTAGLVLGAVLGGLIADQQAPVATAVGLLQVQPDPAILLTGNANTTLSDAQTTSFLQSQLITLNSDAFKTDVQDELGLAEQPVIDVTRLQESDVIQISAEAPSAEIATTIAQTAADLYVTQRQTEIATAVETASATNNDQLAAAQQALDQIAPSAANVVNSASAQRDAAQARYSELLAIQDQLGRANGQAATVVVQRQAAAAEPASGLDPTVAGALGGGTLGVLLTVGTVFVARRFSRRIEAAEDLGRYALPVMSPEVPHRRLRSSALADPQLQQVVATHSPRLAAERDQHPGLVVIGATEGVGASYLALQHAIHAARRRPTVLMRTGGPDDDLIADGLGVRPDSRDLDLLPQGRITTAALRDAVQQTNRRNLYVLSPGGDDASSLGVLESALESGLIESFFDMDWQVVVDAPPLERSTAGLIAARRCGSTVLVVSAGHTVRQEVERALDTVASWQITLSGVIVNRAPRTRAKRRDDDDLDLAPARGDDGGYGRSASANPAV